MPPSLERQQKATYDLINTRGASGTVHYSPDRKSLTEVTIGFHVPDEKAEQIQSERTLPTIIFEHKGGPRTEKFTIAPPLKSATSEGEESTVKYPLKFTPNGELDPHQPNGEKLKQIVTFLVDERTKAERLFDESGQSFLRMTPAAPALLELMKRRGAQGIIRYAPDGEEILAVTINYHVSSDRDQEKIREKKRPAIAFQQSGEPLEERFTLSPELKITPDGKPDPHQPNSEKLERIVTFLLDQRAEAVNFTDKSGWTYMHSESLPSVARPGEEYHPQTSAEKLAAFAEFYRQVEPKLDSLTTFVHNLTGSQLNAEDIVAEVMLRALKNPPRADNLIDWCFVVARHLVIDEYRREALPQHPKPFSARISTGAKDPNAQTLMETVNNLVSHDYIPEDYVLTQEMVETLKRAVHHLPESQRAVVERRLYQDKSNGAIARELGITENATKMSFSRGMARVKAEIDADERG